MAVCLPAHPVISLAGNRYLRCRLPSYFSAPFRPAVWPNRLPGDYALRVTVTEVFTMSLSPYLAFAGNCAEAIAFYQQTLGAELMFKMTFGEMPPPAQEASDGCPSGQKMADDAIAHASLRINNGELMLSDSAFGPDVHYAGFTSSSIPAMSLKASAGSTRWLSAGALRWRQETFWAHGFGKVVDRFGVPG
ncbi:VOC family metalloprotein YjdN [Klebsiella pneumoniae]|nr:VOC family metalloprotein YjdN [Klebsiella pneumoniae]